MKSISKPLLLVEIYAFQEIMSTEDFRKKPLFSRGRFALLPNCEKYTYYSTADGYLADCSLWVEMMHPDSLS